MQLIEQYLQKSHLPHCSIMLLASDDNVYSEDNIMPEFSLVDINDNEISSQDFKNKVLIIDFFATWCPPCIMEIPHLVKIKEEFGESGFEIIGISVDNNPKEVLPNFIKEKNINYPIVLVSTQTVSDFGGIKYLPTTFIVGRDGKITKKFVGYTEPEEFEKIIKTLL